MNRNIISKLIVIFSGIMINQAAFAGDHILGVNLGIFGNQNFESRHGKAEYDSGDLTVSGDIYYRYMFNEYIGVEGGFMSGGGGAFSEWLDQYRTIQDVDYDAGRIAFYSKLPLGRGNSLYGKAGGTSVRIDYEVNGSGMHSTENGFYGAAGWECRFEFGLGINVEYQLTRTNNFETKVINIGSSYLF